MRVFCPEHKRGFLAPRQSPIKCENRDHILGELDFEGESKPAVELQWQYCCNCEHFCPVTLERNGFQNCQVCTRRISLLYLCSRCYTISFESNTPLETKNFTLTSEGVPQPSCPGCLQEASADLYEHTCDRLPVSFVTPLNFCPICEERLDIGPSFPSPVAHYLRRTKAANKLNVTFDYHVGLFVPVKDGEFVLISHGPEGQSMVLPRAARFSHKRDFYEFYQDYYHCAKPDGGEVHIIEPATVTSVGDGWKLEGTGILEVKTDQPTKTAPANTSRKQSIPPPQASASTSVANSEEQSVTPCPHCGSLVEKKYAFCWRCGKHLSSPAESADTIQQKRATISSFPAPATADDETTVQHDRGPMSPPIFSWAEGKKTPRDTSSKKSNIKLLGIGVIGFLVVTVGSITLLRSASKMTPVTAAQTAANDLQADIKPATVSQAAPVVTQSPAAQQPVTTVRPEDEELKKLRDKRIAATDSERPKILLTLVKTERKYPKDYRFPYERAKLVLKGSQATSRNEAFAALSRAAEKAISAGNAREMLDSLNADKSRDFNKLSRERREWTKLLQALKSKDSSLLNDRSNSSVGGN
jgi:hypothetical protein